MKILVVGSSGLVGSRFVELYPKDLLTPSHSELDITSSTSVMDYFSKNRPEMIINFAAYTNVSEAENQRGDKNGLCWQINVEGVKNLLSVGVPLIQISTDMVFAGDAGPYSEDEPTEADSNKVTWYGFTKGEAERLIGTNGAILRLIYPVRAKFDQKLDYLRKPLQLFDQGKLYPLFADQQVSITFIDEACRALQKIIEKNLTGVFHASSRDTATPYDLICYLLQKLGKDASGVQKSSVSSVNNPVRYPKLGGLKVSLPFSTWKQIIDALVAQGIATA